MSSIDVGYIYVGTGSPEAAVTAAVGSVYRRTDGASGTVFYTKETGAGNTGWIAMVSTASLTTAATALLTGLHAAVAADANVIGGLPVLHTFNIANAATADYDIILTHKTEITDILVVKTSGAGVAVTATVKNGANAITDAINLAVADQTLARPLTIDDAFNTIAAAGTLRVSIARTTGDAGCKVFVRGIRRT